LLSGLFVQSKNENLLSVQKLQKLFNFTIVVGILSIEPHLSTSLASTSLTTLSSVFSLYLRSNAFVILRIADIVFAQSFQSTPSLPLANHSLIIAASSSSLVAIFWKVLTFSDVIFLRFRLHSSHLKGLGLSSVQSEAQ